MKVARHRRDSDPLSGAAWKWRSLLAGALVGSALLASGVGIYGWLRQPEIADLPVLDWSEADPAVVTAVETARNAVQRSSRSGSAWGKLGMTLLANFIVPEAQRCFAQAERLDPYERRWPYYRAEILRYSDPDAAISELRRAVELDGKTEPRLRLGNVLILQGQFDEAEAEFRRVLERDANNPWAQLGLGQALHGRGLDSESRAPLESAAGNPATAKTARLLLGEVHQRLGDRAAATREAQTAAKLPDSACWPEPWMDALWELQVGRKEMIQRAETLLHQRQTSRAIALFEKTARAYPNVGEMWLKLGRALSHVNDLPAAERALSRATQLEPSSADAHIELGVVRYRQNNHRAAADCFRKAVTLRPDYALAHFDLSLSLESLGDHAGAIAALRDAVRYRPNFTDAHIHLANLLAQQGQNAEARRHLHVALDLSPDNERARRMLKELKP
jgi:tetratricopeptide (TPR) repeat protein